MDYVTYELSRYHPDHGWCADIWPDGEWLHRADRTEAECAAFDHILAAYCPHQEGPSTVVRWRLGCSCP